LASDTANDEVTFSGIDWLTDGDTSRQTGICARAALLRASSHLWGQQGRSHRSHGPELSAHALRQDACALPRQTVPRWAEGLGRATHAEFPASGWYLKRPLLRVFGIPQNCVRRPVYPLSLGLGLARRHWIISAVWPFGLQALREGEPNDGLLSADGSCSAQARQ
jgi:hypothetical protein